MRESGRYGTFLAIEPLDRRCSRTHARAANERRIHSSIYLDLKCSRLPGKKSRVISLQVGESNWKHEARKVGRERATLEV